MIRLTDIKLPLDHAPEALRAAVLARLALNGAELLGLHLFRRGVDARKRSAIHLIYTVDIAVADEAALLQRCAADPSVRPTPDMTYRLPARAPQGASRPLVIGAGPCGLFAALTLAEMGFRPIVLERGKAVRERTKDTFALWRQSVLTPESNVQFGEGGAGTFSDGKLYSGIKDTEHLGRRVLDVFVRAGAPPEIVWVSKPHIGTFRLVSMVENMRRAIEALGGEYRFESRVERLLITQNPRRIAGVRLASGEEINADRIVLAPGHSARDLFASLVESGVHIDQKPFSVGVRIEHPQSVIDRARYGAFAGNKILGAADYKLVHHCTNGRSVYSFCMCPGGTVVAAASEPGGVVTNGMSQYSRARAQRQCRHRGWHHTCRLSGRRAGRRGVPAPPRIAGLYRRRQFLRRARPVGWRLPGQPSQHRAGQRDPILQARRGCRPTWRAACPITRWPQSARRCPCSAARLPASICRTPS